MQRPPAEVVHEVGADGERSDWRLCVFQDRDRRQAAPEDAIGQDSARRDAEDRRQRRTTKCPRPSTTRQSSTRSKPPSNISATPQNWGRDKFHFLPRVRRVYGSGPQAILLQQRRSSAASCASAAASTSDQRGQDAPRAGHAPANRHPRQPPVVLSVEPAVRCRLHAAPQRALRIVGGSGLRLDAERRPAACVALSCLGSHRDRAAAP